MSQNDYCTAALLRRWKLKAFTSSSSSLSDQEILDLLNDSLRSYVVPMMGSLREEFWVGKSDIVVNTDVNGSIDIPDSVASSLRTVAWSNAGILVPLTRIEPENAFPYLSQQSALPYGFMLRGNTLIVLPKAPNIEMHLTAMLRPPQMVLTEEAALIDTAAGATLTLDSVPVEWQATTPTSVDLISGVSPFGGIGTFGVSSLVVATKTLVLTTSPTLTGEAWVADVARSPFASVSCELYPLLEQDAIVQFFGSGVGDKRAPAAEKRRDTLLAMVKRPMAPRTQGNAQVIVNPNAPGMRNSWGMFGSGRR